MLRGGLKTTTPPNEGKDIKQFNKKAQKTAFLSMWKNCYIDIAEFATSKRTPLKDKSFFYDTKKAIFIKMRGTSRFTYTRSLASFAVPM